MARYRVTFYFDEVFEVDAESESEAEDKAYERLKNHPTRMCYNEVEIENLEEDDFEEDDLVEE